MAALPVEVERRRSASQLAADLRLTAPSSDERQVAASKPQAGTIDEVICALRTSTAGGGAEKSSEPRATRGARGSWGAWPPSSLKASAKRATSARKGQRVASLGR